MDLTGIMAKQVVELYLENKLKEEKANQTELERDQEDKQKSGVEKRIELINFTIVKNKVENSHFRGILEALAQKLNSSNPEFALLKTRIADMNRHVPAPHGKIDSNSQFAVSKPRDYGGYFGSYHILFYVDGGQKFWDYTIFSVSYAAETGHFGFDIHLYGYNLHDNFYHFDPESIARKIIDNLMGK